MLLIPICLFSFSSLFVLYLLNLLPNFSQGHDDIYIFRKIQSVMKKENVENVQDVA